MYSFISRSLLYPLFAVLFVIGVVSTPAFAAPNKAATAEKKTQASPQDLELELRKIGMQLNQIQHKAIASNPKLQAKRHHFSKHMVMVEKKLGYTPGTDTKQLMDIKKSILTGKLKKDEREAKIKKFLSVREHLMKGQEAAMKDQALDKEGKMLRESTLVAMRSTDPRTDNLIKRYNTILLQLRGMMGNKPKAKK